MANLAYARAFITTLAGGEENVDPSLLDVFSRILSNFMEDGEPTELFLDTVGPVFTFIATSNPEAKLAAPFEYTAEQKQAAQDAAAGAEPEQPAVPEVPVDG